ncbi:hypothetical protein LIER_15111 [Lithospermum erythrorhizon]|uniref:RNase H type-1 domain-containing protein n=1 Tax=Lithospermum erythrorhizon TaxID=34254 RepID=A0AAV3Q1P6_LITER
MLNGELQGYFHVAKGLDSWHHQDTLVASSDTEQNLKLKVKDVWTNGAWDLGKLTNLISQEDAVVTSQIHIQAGSPDQLLWKTTSNGQFSLKDAYSLCGITVFQKKISMVAWTLYQGLIPVDVVVQRKGVQLASQCVCCNHIETLEHVFFTNAITNKVWILVASMFGFTHAPYQNVQGAVIAWTLAVNTKGHIRQIIPMVIIWALWEARNQSKHDGTTYTFHKVMSRVMVTTTYICKSCLISYKHWKGDVTMVEHFQAQILVPPPRALSVVTWAKPSIGVLKLNVDGSYGLSHSAAGGVLRDSNGDLIMAFSLTTHPSSPLEAEVDAALNWCVANNFTLLQVETDN